MKVYLVYDNEMDGSGDCWEFEILKVFDTREKAVTFWSEYEHRRYPIRFTYAGCPAEPAQIKELEVE